MAYDPNEEIIKRALKRDRDVVQFARAYERALKNGLRRLVKRIQSGDEETQIEAAQTAAVIGRLNESLIELGLQAELDKIGTLYEDELRDLAKHLKKIDPKLILTDIDADFAQTMINDDFFTIWGETAQRVGGLKSAVTRALITGERPDFDEMVERYGATVANQIETELQTGLSSFNQALTNKKAAEVGFDYFVYLGPDDRVTRPFCADIIRRGRVFRKEDILKMTNDQGLPVMEYCGGWNCRHQWAPTETKKDAEKFADMVQAPIDAYKAGNGS